jgi:orotate phosphoribosyltransferase-like protein
VSVVPGADGETVIVVDDVLTDGVESAEVIEVDVVDESAPVEAASEGEGAALGDEA